MKEIEKLKQMLKDNKIPCEVNSSYCKSIFGEGYIDRVAYPSVKNRVCYAIQGAGTYGNDENLIEIMGLLTDEEKKRDSIVGYLTADEVFKRISTHYSKTHRVNTKHQR